MAKHYIALRDEVDEYRMEALKGLITIGLIFLVFGLCVGCAAIALISL